jgi:glutathione S-transferase
MPGKYKHYGWECSPYSSKTRAYLRYKQIPHQDIYPTLVTFKRVIERKVGFIVMPIVITPDGSVIQDTSDIIDHFEAHYPTPSISPSTPTQHLVSLVFELFADEWFPLISMNSRWNNAENRRFITAEFGRCALPWLPTFIGKLAVNSMARRLRSYLPVLGITDDTRPEIEAWQKELFAGLNKHFEVHPFLLGSRPCLGDFALYGPVYAHVWRDPGSRHLVESHPSLLNWMNRVRDPSGNYGNFIDDDQIPPTLHGILSRIFKEQWPVLQQTAAAVNSWLSEHPDSKKIPRSLGVLEFSVGTAVAERKILTFQHWMLQRSMDFYQSLGADERGPVDAFLQSVGGLKALGFPMEKRLTRERFRVVPQR